MNFETQLGISDSELGAGLMIDVFFQKINVDLTIWKTGGPNFYIWDTEHSIEIIRYRLWGHGFSIRY